EAGEDGLDDPGEDHSALDADDHGVSAAALAVAGGPHAAGDDTVVGAPDEDVVEAGEALGVLELVPCSGLDVAADAFGVEDAFDDGEALGLDADLDVIVPTRVPAEGGEEQLARGRGL